MEVKTMIRVNFDNLDYTDEGLHVWQGKPFTGIAYENFPNGQRQSEVTFIDGIKNGTTREWYPSGHLETEQHIVHGSKHGECREWFENGQLKIETTYEFGILVRKKVWNETGELVQEFEITEHDNLYSVLQTFRKTRGYPDNVA
jgi:antitoxin component YwqK of YwqJK toxin-antitoxin module